MNAREKYQILLDGKIIHIELDNGEWAEFKLRKSDGAELSRYSHSTEWAIEKSLHNNDNATISPEYNLTFAQAVQAMEDGGLVAPEGEGNIRYSRCRNGWGDVYLIHSGISNKKTGEITGVNKMWKVIE